MISECSTLDLFRHASVFLQFSFSYAICSIMVKHTPYTGPYTKNWKKNLYRIETYFFRSSEIYQIITTTLSVTFSSLLPSLLTLLLFSSLIIFQTFTNFYPSLSFFFSLFSLRPPLTAALHSPLPSHLLDLQPTISLLISSPTFST